MKTTEQLINNLIGQLTAVKRMTNAGEDCFQVLTQMKAVKAGLAKVMEKYLAAEMKACLRRGGGDERKMEKMIAELTKT